MPKHLIAFSLILICAWGVAQADHPTRPPKTPPTVRLALGWPWHEVAQQSRYPFPARKLQNLDLVFFTSPFTFEYKGGCGFTLPASRSGSVSVDNQHVTSARVSPHLAYLRRPQALDLVDRTSALLAQAHWQNTRTYYKRADLNALINKSRGRRIRVSDWHCGDDEAFIQVQTSEEKSHEASIEVTVGLENDKVRSRFPGILPPN